MIKVKIFRKQDRMLQTGSIVFDACTFEIWGALLNGIELYIIKKQELLDANKLKEYISKNRITILWVTAPLFNKLCEEPNALYGVSGWHERALPDASLQLCTCPLT